MLDAQPYLADTDYFFIGNGTLMVAIQWSRTPEASPYGIILCDPERMSRKHGSLLFQPELGLARTMLTVVANGVRYSPRHEDVQARWDLHGRDSVVLQWHAGAVQVTERFTVHSSSSMLIRDVSLQSPGGITVHVEAALYANPLFFDEFGARASCELYANGYASMHLDSIPRGRAFERFLTVPVRIPEGTSAGTSRAGTRVTFTYTLEARGTHEYELYPEGHMMPAYNDDSPALPEGMPGTLEQRMMRAYEISRTSLRACISSLGKFDAAIWQYDFEWGVDAAMVAGAASMAGMFDVARAVLHNILDRLSNAEGMIAESSRFRGGEMSELNGNGAVLDALRQYWRFSGDDSLMRVYWERIGAIAEYPLRDEFLHQSGLLRTRRDFWERTPWMGVADGFEIGYQAFCAVGLRSAAAMADALGHTEQAARWREAADRMARAITDDEHFALVEDGRLIRRRLADGTVQWTMAPDTEYAEPDYLPYIPAYPSAGARALPCEPDATEALPIIYGLVDPSGPIAHATVRAFDALWDPSGVGGYARYHPLSDPDSPGAWPFATAFIAAAELETGMMDRARRTIAWLLDIAGEGGSWFEFYGARRSALYPPIGIIVWGWAQYMILMVRHAVGARIEGDALVVRPRFAGLVHTLHIGGHAVRITTTGMEAAEAPTAGAALLNGAPIDLTNGEARLRLPLTADHHLEFLTNTLAG